MDTHSEFAFPHLSNWHKTKYLNYAQQVLESQHIMTTLDGQNALHYTKKEEEHFAPMIHYPRGDRIDYKTGAQYFYHCHRENFELAEHGHFHCFLRFKHIPKSIKPAPLADWDRYIDNPMTHLIAIGMNQLGQPIRLFTVNRWVTSEIWYNALESVRLFKRYKIAIEDDPYWQVLDRWVEGVIQLFKPQICWLHQERDKKILQHRQNTNSENPYIDTDLEELSEISVDLKKQIEWIINA